MSGDWQADDLSMNFTEHIVQILAPFAFRRARPEEDYLRASDMIAEGAFAIRIRDLSFMERYPDEFTIRSSRPRGTKTELQKILEGSANYLLYGFGSEYDLRLEDWRVGDLRVFRTWYNRECLKSRNGPPGIHNKNVDGSSGFYAFRWADLPPGFIVAAHPRHDLQSA